MIQLMYNIAIDHYVRTLLYHFSGITHYIIYIEGNKGNDASSF